MSSLKQRIDEQLFRPVDASSLVVFRFLFGAIMFIEVLRFFSKGWISRYFIEPVVLFKYYGFEWVEPLPGVGMYWVFVVMGLAAVGVMIGAFYRLATIVLFLSFGYVFLLDMAKYLNHFYLVILVIALLACVPANRTWAVDAWIRPRIRSDTVPGWAIWIFRLQFEVVLLYAGIVKLNPDWLHLEPMGMWLARRADFPLVGQYFTEAWAVVTASYGVIMLHLVGAPLLLFRRTRLYVIVVYFVFHLMNFVLFRIGIFPWVTMAATLLFLDPDWPKQLRERFQGRRLWSAGPDVARPSRRGKTLVLSLMGLWLGFQILFPLRHLFYPGYALWTEEGQKFAWQMKLHDKQGRAVFLVENPDTGHVRRVEPGEYLMPHQARRIAGRPEMIRQFAHFLAGTAGKEGARAPVVRAEVCVSLNGRREAWLIDPRRDLTRVERRLGPADWILPLEHPPERPSNPRGREDIRCEPFASGS